MRAIAISSYSTPSGYELRDLPKPELRRENDVIIKVHAASVNPVDVKLASGQMKMVFQSLFPSPIGFDCAGTVVEIGSEVTRFKVGDEALRKYDGDLSGKTVFIPAGLSGTGAYACQLAKNVFKAGKVITTVSTAKVPKVAELLGDNVVDEIIDYKESDPATAIPAKSVDFLFDTVGVAMEYLPLVRQDGWVISISTMPSGSQLQEWDIMHLPHNPTVPAYVRIPLNLLDRMKRLKAQRYGAHYEYMFLTPSGEDLDSLRAWVEEGKVRPVVGTVADFHDIDAIRRVCQVVYDGQGGLGKVVISMVE
ncbi:NADP-dependent oxidoreductase [Aspergillus tanneri]|uniref:Enoyl reductase (ER) domain-containing protein n=1 Tax=Aspergillus tanneri TaxID=1220188 RepID=A0A5M9N553_9EURO|nr:uncharacterized protein ATNIH1004_001749 [Aspergillus tanneri]KAA8652840.1 hypothetical protein ATNIH1004_001749 [Aspergillus tanneri]